MPLGGLVRTEVRMSEGVGASSVSYPVIESSLAPRPPSSALPLSTFAIESFQNTTAGVVARSPILDEGSLTKARGESTTCVEKGNGKRRRRHRTLTT